VAHHGVSAQGLNAELTQRFFNGVIDNLQHLAERNRQTSQQLADQQQRQQEAPQQLTQESVGVYMNFINSMFAF
jgi:cell shape-determining protein MreC